MSGNVFDRLRYVNIVSKMANEVFFLLIAYSDFYTGQNINGWHPMKNAKCLFNHLSIKKKIRAFEE